MPNLYEESDSKAGFYYDIKFLVMLIYILFAISSFALGPILSVNIFEVTLMFLSLLIFFDLQEFIEVRVPRYGWKCSRIVYKLASAILIVGALLVPIATRLINSEMIIGLPQHASVLLFLFFLGSLTIPILGIALALICYLDFANSLGISLWRRDKDVVAAISEYSFFYRKLSGILRRD